MPEPPRYTFGETPLAARRLALLAEVLDAPSRAVPRLPTGRGAAAPSSGPRPRLWPGPLDGTRRRDHGRTVGLDASAAFVDAARRSFANLEFTVHDVTVTPFPVAEPNLVFARLVLAHLPDPACRARTWGQQLAPGGRLLLDELDALDAPDPVFRRYEELVGGVVADRGGPMHAGPLLTDLTDGPDFTLWSSTALTLPVPVRVTARLYAMNLQVWRHDPFARTHFAAAELDALARSLADLTRDGQGRVDWRLRHVVVERRG